MTARWTTTIALSLLLWLAVGITLAQRENAPAAEPEAANVQPSWDHYRETVVVGNIFSRDRGRRPEPPSTGQQQREQERQEPKDREPPKPTDPGDHFALRGISYIGDTRHAFFEDLRDGAIRVIRTGDTLGSRIITELNLDSIHVEPDHNAPVEDDLPPPQAMTIRIGHTLTGNQPSSVRAATPRSGSNGSRSESQSSAESDSDAEPSDDQNLSIEERLRRRREQQLNR